MKRENERKYFARTGLMNSMGDFCFSLLQQAKYMLRKSSDIINSFRLLERILTDSPQFSSQIFSSRGNLWASFSSLIVSVSSLPFNRSHQISRCGLRKRKKYSNQKKYFKNRKKKFFIEERNIKRIFIGAIVGIWWRWEITSWIAFRIFARHSTREI